MRASMRTDRRPTASCSAPSPGIVEREIHRQPACGGAHHSERHARAVLGAREDEERVRWRDLRGHVRGDAHRARQAEPRPATARPPPHGRRTCGRSRQRLPAAAACGRISSRSGFHLRLVLGSRRRARRRAPASSLAAPAKSPASIAAVPARASALRCCGSIASAFVDELERATGERASLRHAERIGVVGEDRRVARHELRQMLVGIRRLLEASQRTEERASRAQPSASSGRSRTLRARLSTMRGRSGARSSARLRARTRLASAAFGVPTRKYMPKAIAGMATATSTATAHGLRAATEAGAGAASRSPCARSTSSARASSRASAGKVPLARSASISRRWLRSTSRLASRRWVRRRGASAAGGSTRWRAPRRS